MSRKPNEEATVLIGVVDWLARGLNAGLGWLVEWLIAGTVGIVALSWAVAESGQSDCEVVVHVVESNVELIVGDQTFQIAERPIEPLVCNLSRGPQTMILRRGDELLQETNFEVRDAAQNVVLTAYDPKRVERAQVPLAEEESAPFRAETNEQGTPSTTGVRSFYRVSHRLSPRTH